MGADHSHQQHVFVGQVTALTGASQTHRWTIGDEATRSVVGAHRSLLLLLFACGVWTGQLRHALHMDIASNLREFTGAGDLNPLSAGCFSAAVTG